ncbi:transport system permease protein [Methanocaldococcus vulcanius M7]|uniref:Transport system permease protein n=1 Tax=Methanocaldococcus vulcanius (strain ATCC 700851 / DSM 12094 / M7) TaxID=579137 RepID=C9RGB4_METVM|nr:iron ABC transporter permease [Methanocaldococcus vulcanius]ACX72616.1 transport system permease protein [Methanocaldococcus vulcanius M7]
MNRVGILSILFVLSLILPFTALYLAGDTHLITLKDIVDFLLTGTTGDKFKDIIIKDIRLPPIIGAVLIGLTLSVAGLMLQTLFRNLLASPYTTGISSGVLMVVALVIFVDSLSHLFEIFGGKSILVAGWCGGIFSMILLIIIALRVREANGVIIVALLLSYFFMGLRAYLIANAEELKIQEYWGFTVGSLSKITLGDIIPMTICSIVFIIGVMFLIKSLNALLFGEQYAKSFGLDIKKTRILILFFASFITGAIIPYVGLIAFIGIIAPYLARPLIKTSDHRYLVPATMFLGVILMVSCHILSLKYYLPIHYIYGINRPASPLPIGAVLDILGGLLVVYLVYKGEKKIKIDY